MSALPEPGFDGHWTVGRKAAVVDAVRDGILSRAAALQNYRITDEEFDDWCARRPKGHRALRITYRGRA